MLQFLCEKKLICYGMVIALAHLYSLKNDSTIINEEDRSF